LTVAALADATGLGRSTIGKALSRLEAAGYATRTTNGSAGRARQPDHWNPAAAAKAPASEPTPTGATATATATDTDTDTDDVTPLPQPALEPASTSTRSSRSARQSTRDSARGSAKDPTAGPRNPKSGTTRLAPGGLTRLVADHFSGHPGVPLTAGEVGRVLNRSGGAVRNACDKLVNDGALRLLGGGPRRYTTPD
jgi:hypothetical protein